METITVYSGFSKRLNSTKRPTGGSNINVVLKQPTSVITPAFRISGFNTSWNYIQWGNRYYFVRDIVIETNTQAIYNCELDVLATYKDNIGSSSQYVTRSSAASDGNICDSLYPTKTQVSHSAVALSNIHTKYNVNNGQYVVGIKNGDSTDGVTFYAMSPTQFGHLASAMFDAQWLDATDISQNLQKMLVDPMQFIVSVYWYPFKIKDGTGAVGVNFGWWTSRALGYKLDSADRIQSVTDPLTLPNHPQISRGNYLNGAPFTQMVIDAFGFGRVPVDVNMFLTSRSASIQIAVDVFTGIGELTMESTEGRVLKQTALVGVPIQLSQVTQDVIHSALATMNTARSIMQKDVVGAASGIADAIQSAMPQVRSTGSVGSIIAYNKTPTLNVINYHIVDEDNAQLGRPLCEVRQISTIAGYIRCENVDIDNVGTTSEKRAIIDYMERGFFYE